MKDNQENLQQDKNFTKALRGFDQPFYITGVIIITDHGDSFLSMKTKP